ncbi:pyridoxal phosphate-dependent aminotransferase [Candidatus Bandiella numerosa]|uniref:pyridoxal phosphate-dependent aminotransferase n=1 Tax=Candidatus Bandiella numerosa TaxID=2570586 RepID=UPI00249EB59F|nr:pyridoxal phosphate-dependent aminotransferase [Candidatus Bandiella numerosa]WHA05509.1 pyridoxal phosphate-dependent aminotransferase [Candidatus Bandiella numerosa]
MDLKANLISEKLKLIKPSPTLAVTTKAKALKAEGKDVIDLGAGEPDFDTPENVKQAAYAAIKSGKTKYTAVDGIPELKKSIVNKFQKENKLNYSTDQITVGCGAKHVIYNIIVATINPDDEVIIPSPYWVSYPDMVLINGGKPVIAKTSRSENFKLTPEVLRKNITNRTKLLILNSPSNPTGACYSENELKALGDVLNNYPNIYIISDDIYEHIRYQNYQYINIANINDELKNRTFVVNGVSKAYSMTGWRIGYAAGDKDLIKAVAKIQSQSTSNPCSISQYASVEALSENSYEFIEKSKLIFKERRDLVIEKLNKISGIQMDVPDGAFYIFPGCEELIGRKTPSGMQIKNCTDFAQYLLEEVLVAVVPGIAFGAENFFRISYATSDQNLLEACERIKKACEKLV